MGQQASAAARLAEAGAQRSRGFILWFTGMSGAGKSTLSQEVRRRLEGEHSVSDPYEPPESPEVTVYTDAETVERSVERILEALRQRELVTRP